MQAKTEREDREVRAPFSGVMGLTDVEVGDRSQPKQPLPLSMIFLSFISILMPQRQLSQCLNKNLRSKWCLG